MPLDCVAYAHPSLPDFTTTAHRHFTPTGTAADGAASAAAPAAPSSISPLASGASVDVAKPRRHVEALEEAKVGETVRVLVAVRVDPHAGYIVRDAEVLAGRREGTLDLVAVDQARLATGRARAARRAVRDRRDIGLGLNKDHLVCPLDDAERVPARAAFRPPLGQLLREFAATDRREELPVLVLSEVPRGQGAAPHNRGGGAPAEHGGVQQLGLAVDVVGDVQRAARSGMPCSSTSLDMDGSVAPRRSCRSSIRWRSTRRCGSMTAAAERI